MHVVPLPIHASQTNRPYVNLISAGIVQHEQPLLHLKPDFEVRQYAPREVCRRAVHEREAMMYGTVATLVDWDDQSPVVLSVLKEVARRHTVPLVVLCGANRAEHVAALVVGGDDVLLRPVNPIMLQARLLAYQRLMEGKYGATEVPGGGGPVDDLPDITPAPPDEHDVCTVGPLTLDDTARRFYVYGRQEVLPTRAFDLIAFLMRRAGTCHTRDAILNEVWGIDFDTETNILDVQVYRLRVRLKTYGLDHMIETVRGVGYRLCSS